ncbi:MAG: DUF427 domain-containing protein [Thermoleophilia bacterium]
MVRAIWNGAVLAESDETAVVEGNHYFPAADVVSEYLDLSDRTTVCPWKGVAGYYDVVVDGARNPGAAWFYPHPKRAAREVAGRVAFWRGVEVVDDAAPARRGLFRLRR